MNANRVSRVDQANETCQLSHGEHILPHAATRPRHSFQALILCYLISFVLPAIKTTGNFGTLWGIQAFALLDLYPYWLANPALWLGLYSFRRARWRIAASCGFVATLLALSVPVIMRWEDQLRPPPPGLTSTLLPGYYVWLASPVLLAFWSIRLWLADSRSDDGATN